MEDELNKEMSEMMTAVMVKSMKEMRMMMERMMTQKDKHNEGPGRKKRD